MKKIIITIAAIIALTSCDCPPMGTVEQIPTNGKIELHRFYYTDGGSYVYVARFKDQPNVTTTNWYESAGKTVIMRQSIAIDSFPETCTMTVSPSYTLSDAAGNTTVVTKVR